MSSFWVVQQWGYRSFWAALGLGLLFMFFMWERLSLDRRRIAELREADERLRKMGMLKDEFVAQVSHELRTPLAVVREGVSQLLEEIRGPLPADQRETLSLTLRNIDRLSALIEDLLDISKVEAGRLPMCWQAFNLGDLVSEVFHLFQTRALERGLALRMNVPDRDVVVFADREKIIQVFTNLIANALKFTKTGSVELSMEQANGTVLCAVTDTGPGIAVEDMPKLFQKFQQIRRAENPAEKGTGLGLAICKGIVELHGGKIWAESVVGKGARFLFTLPAVSGNLARAA